MFKITKEIPEFLIRMSKEMATQNNCITADPLFEVRCKRYLVTEKGYSESHWELHGPDSEGRPTYSSAVDFEGGQDLDEFYDENESWCEEWLEERDLIGRHNFIESFSYEDHYASGDDWPEGYYVVHMQEVEETIKTCFTRSSCQQFIDRKQHDYPKLYIYVTSMYFCTEMIELRNWIMSLTEGDECSK